MMVRMYERFMACHDSWHDFGTILKEKRSHAIKRGLLGVLWRADGGLQNLS
jgi:hypothetical protein